MSEDLSNPSDHQPTPVSPETATIYRDDSQSGGAYPADLVWSPQETVTGFGEGHRYRLIRVIGRGGMGVVHEGWDSQLCRSVAIKLMERPQRQQPAAPQRQQPEALQRFFREARIASQLAHPGIVTIHEFGVTLDGQAFIVMELLLGKTLRQVLADISDRGGELPRLLNIFSETCLAMASAHQRGVIHRDLKPSNVMVCPFGVVSVMDWGVAKLLPDARPLDPAPLAVAAEFTADPPDAVPLSSAAEEHDDQTAALESLGHTMAGTIFGTPAYLPPEQARGDMDQVDCRSDVFGLGSILCEILTGSAPFAAESSDERCRQSAAGDLTAAFTRLDECRGPLPLVRLAKQCLAAEPEARPANAGEVAAAVTAYLESGQRRAEQELVQFFDLSLDLFCIAGLNGTFHRLNDNVQGLLGYQAADLINQPFLDYVHPDDQERTRSELSHLADEKPTFHFLNRYRHANGHYVWLEWNAHAVIEEGAVYAVARDVSDRMAAQELRLKLEQERETIATFTAAAGLFLTAPGSLKERLRNVVEEGTMQLGLLAMEVWLCGKDCTQPTRFVTSDPSLPGIDQPTVDAILSSYQPRQMTITKPVETTSAGGSRHQRISSIVGYPLVIGHHPLGLLAIYAEESLSEMHVTALTTTVVSLALAIAAEA